MKLEEQWKFYLENFEMFQKACGVRLEKGVWVLFDKTKAQTMPEPMRSWLKEVLLQKKMLGKFKVENPSQDTNP